MSKPVIELRSGAVRVSVWENERKDGNASFVVTSIKPERCYRDKKDGAWKSTGYFTPADLLPLAELCRLVYAKLGVKERTPAEDGARSDNDGA